MPDISLPEVRLKGKLPEGLRDLTVDDIQRAMPDVHLPNIDLGRETRKLGRDARKAARQAERATREARKTAAKEAGKAARAVEKALPRRSGPNPVPIAILAMLGGVVVGWLLSRNPATGPRINALMSDLRTRLDQWRGRGSEQFDDEWDTTGVQTPADSGAAPAASEPYTGTLSTPDAALGTTTTQLPDVATTDPDHVAAGNGASTTNI